MKRTLTTTLGAFALLAAAPAFAYVPSQSQWDPTSLPVPYRVNAASAPSTLGSSNGLAAVQAGFTSWAGPACTTFRASYAGATSLAAGNVRDRENSILWISGRWPADLGDVNSVIGVTTPVWTVGGYFIDADIQFNDVGFTWTADGRNGSVDTQSIAVHEEGHFLGLDHTRVSSAIMFASYSGGQKRVLHSDDQAGVCALYPSGQPLPDAGPTPDRCASSVECGTCTPREGCGWCGASNACVSADQNGPLNGTCASGWAWLPAECSGGSTAGGAFGDPCQRSSDCASGGRCVSTGGSGGFCTRTCADDCGCPGGYACFPTSTAGLSVCAPGTNTCGTTRPDAGTTRPDATPPVRVDTGVVGAPDQGFFSDGAAPPGPDAGNGSSGDASAAASDEDGGGRRGGSARLSVASCDCTGMRAAAEATSPAALLGLGLALLGRARRRR